MTRRAAQFTLAACAVVAGSGGSPQAGDDGTPQNDRVRVTRAELGPAWPFTAEAGVLRCRETADGAAVTFESEGKVYALNEPAKAAGHADVRPIRNVDHYGKPRDLSLLVERGLELCR